MMKRTNLLFVVVVMALMSAALLMTNSGFKLIARSKSLAESRLLSAAESEPTVGWTTTPGPSTTNLKGKMFTLSSAGGGIRFYPPYYSDMTPNPWTSTTPFETSRGTTRSYSTSPESYSPKAPPTTKPPTTKPPTTKPPTTKPPTTKRPTTRHWPTRPWTTRHWTTAPAFSGVSVCLRYLGGPQRDEIRLFSLSPSTNPLRLSFNAYAYILSFSTYPYRDMYMIPSIRLWNNIDSEMWTRVCLTIDNTRNVVQLFSGSNMSIRKILPNRYVWSGEPVIDFPGFDGQVTDVQVWDYPLRYKEVFNYMTNGVYMSYRGSVITWSYITYSLRGNALLEDVYEKQAGQPIGSSGRGRGQGRRPMGERKTKVMFKEVESRERNIQWFK